MPAMKRILPLYRRRSDYRTEQRRRIESARLFRRGRSQAEVARELGVSRQAASRWHALWRAGGQTALAGVGRTGRKRKLTGDHLCRLEAILLAGARARGYETDLWTLKRIAQVIRREFGATYHAGHVWKVLGQLGWSCQRPERRARERDERAIRRWLHYRWPRIKKRPTPPTLC
jgi:transposase